MVRYKNIVGDFQPEYDANSTETMPTKFDELWESLWLPIVKNTTTRRS